MTWIVEAQLRTTNRHKSGWLIVEGWPTDCRPISIRPARHAVLIPTRDAAITRASELRILNSPWRYRIREIPNGDIYEGPEEENQP